MYWAMRDKVAPLMAIGPPMLLTLLRRKSLARAESLGRGSVRADDLYKGRGLLMAKPDEQPPR